MIFSRDQMSIDALYAAMKTSAGLSEFVIGVVCLTAGWWLARYVFRRWFAPVPARLDQFLPYLGLRLVVPISAQALLVLCAVGWVRLLGHKPHVLLAFAAMLFWMVAIRLSTALIREALPRGRIGRTSEKVVSSVLWLAFVTWTIDLDDMVISWTDSVSFTVGKTHLDLSMVLSALLWASVIMIVALWLSRVIEKRVMGIDKIDLNLRIVVGKLSRTILMVAAVLITLPMVGIDLTVLSVFGGALGVGLGFGLQKLTSSYVSGFILLLERSVRIGDRLTIDNRVGYVTRITSRFVVLKGLDGTDALVPNDLIISNTVVNQSYTDTKIWSSVSVDVAYGTDIELALTLLNQAASQPRILSNSAPTAYVTLLGPSGISLQVGFWITDPENGYMVLHSDIYRAIWRLFVEHHIQVPLPQSAVTLLNPLPVIPAPAPAPLAAEVEAVAGETPVAETPVANAGVAADVVDLATIEETRAPGAA